MRTVTPTGETALLGRPFVHGAWDCWQVCADWYKREWGLEFPAYAREEGWWEKADGPSLYEQAYEAAGFYQVSQPQRGDMIVMAAGRTAHPNHAGIYLGSEAQLSGETAQVLSCSITCTADHQKLSCSAALGSTGRALCCVIGTRNEAAGPQERGYGSGASHRGSGAVSA